MLYSLVQSYSDFLLNFSFAVAFAWFVEPSTVDGLTVGWSDIFVGPTSEATQDDLLTKTMRRNNDDQP